MNEKGKKAKKSMKAILIENGEAKIIENDKMYFGDFARDFLGKDITVERVYLNDNRTLIMAIDEEGVIKELPFNFFMEMNNPHYPIQVIVGKAIVIRVDEVDWRKGEIWDYEVVDITDEDISKVSQFLDDEYMMKLSIEYMKKAYL